MKTLLLTALCSLLAFVVCGQSPVPDRYVQTDGKALAIPPASTGSVAELAAYISSHFPESEDKIRAAFIWVASNIEYDVDHMYSMNFNRTREHIVQEVLKTRKGTCAGYAALFDALCGSMGFKAYEIEGYTRQNGIQAFLPHAWNAVLLADEWYLFDPTWGSGYYADGKFVPRINNSYFKAKPAELIQGHMPFDYLFQFLDYPVTREEFARGEGRLKEDGFYFNYTDSLALFDHQDTISRMSSSAYRIERNGVSNDMVFAKLRFLNIEVERQKELETVSFCNAAHTDNNLAVEFMNRYISYWNKQFQPLKPDEEIQAMLDTVRVKLQEGTEKLALIRYPQGREEEIASLGRVLEDNRKELEEKQEWLNVYFSKKKAGRKSMFVKYTWFGIPLN